MGPGEVAQAGGRVFRGDVALGRAEEFESDHELPDRRRAEERRQEVGVEVEPVVGQPVGRMLVDAHRVRERGFEEVLVSDGDGMEGVGEPLDVARLELIEPAEVSTGKDHRLEGPDRPERDDDDEGFVRVDGALGELLLQGGVAAEQTGSVGEREPFERGRLLAQLVRHARARPDLAVGMGVARTHHLAPVLEDLDRMERVPGGEFDELLTPHGDETRRLR